MAAKGKKKSDQLVSQGPPPGVDVTNGPIGVGPDYQAPNPSHQPGFIGPPSAGETIAPRYFSGDQNTEVVGLSPEDRADLQLQLKHLGLIGAKTKIVLGVWDATSAAAFKQVLAWANSTGADWKTALSDMTAAGGMFAADAPAQVKQATNPLDVQALGQQTGLNYLGQGLTSDQQTQFQSDYAAKQAPYLSSDATMSDPGAAGWQEWAKTKVRDFDPVNFDAHKVLAGVDVLSQMLGSA